uniref:Uncharacterized protein n=1 Tax=Anguilla anguilla TaxID=7936 RepID=A0A0E9SQ13_ANGAN
MPVLSANVSSSSALHREQIHTEITRIFTGSRYE